MIKRLILSGLLLGLLSANVAVADGVDMQEGLWEITTKVEMPGMPMQMPSMTTTQCLTPQDLVPQNEQPDNACEMTSHQINGNTVTWSVACEGEEGGTHGNGTVTYHGDSFEGTMTMSMGGGMQMTSTMHGRRVGPCK